MGTAICSRCSCATRIFPYDIKQFHRPFRAGKFGGVSDCCGLPAMRSGLVDAGRRVSDDLVNRLSQCRFNRLVVMCGSCWWDMFCNYMPGHLDQQFPFPVISIYEYLDEQIQNGRLTIQRQIEPQKRRERMRLYFHSCYGHTFGDAYLRAIDRLAKVVAMTARSSRIPEKRISAAEWAESTEKAA
ncbi:MAG: hypothetical protein R2875_18200 [Desulfobacterales bacterium]